MAYQDHHESCIICLDHSPTLVSNVRCRCVYWYHTSCLNATPNKTQCPMCRAEVGPIYTDADPMQLPVTITTITTPLVTPVTQPILLQQRTASVQFQTKLVGFLCVASGMIIIMFIVFKFLFGA